jgi:hypothetical protein
VSDCSNVDLSSVLTQKRDTTVVVIVRVTCGFLAICVSPFVCDKVLSGYLL